MNEYISKLYSQLTGKTFSDARLAFEQLVINSSRTGDLYFETFGIPNTIEVFNAPYERFVCYEFLMNLLKNDDATKYSIIHKGTPYYFLAWMAFEIRNYSKAVFYLDLALGEDIRKVNPNNKSQADIAIEALGNPGGNLWKFIPDGPAVRVIQQLKVYFVAALSNFKTRTGEEINLDDFINKFVMKSIPIDVRNRSLISAFYSYIYEINDIYNTLIIRSQNETSIEPLLVSLFKGGLIFESLLKSLADQKSWRITRGRGVGYTPISLDAFNRCPDFLTFFSLSSRDFQTSATNLSSVLSIATDNSLKTSFNISAQLRNTAGHDLRRDDIFQNPDDYKNLFEKELNAMFYLIKRAYL